MTLLQHEACIDTAIEIIKRFYVPEKDVWKMRVMWWRISRVNEPRCMGIIQSIEIKNTDLPKWRPL